MGADAGPRRVLIVGATSAIAGEVARLYARRGASLVLTGRNPVRLAAVGDDLRVRGAASVETEVPQTATRVVMFYRVNSGYVKAQTTENVRRGLDGRFELQVNQSLPFMNFTSAHWEMLVAVSNLFKEALYENSVYDELMVVRPPKRVLGGVTVRF